MGSSGTNVRGRVVALVGRPNVGKSALFNSMVGRRLAIVHELPGVTRDRVTSEVTWRGERFELVDTGGLVNVEVSPDHASELERAIRQQTELAISDAALLVLVVDVTEGLHPLDETIAQRLRERGCSVVVAANKADNEAREIQALEFEKLGFPVFAVSALHKRGLSALLDHVIRHLPREPMQEAPKALRIAIVGRPNVGKSSFINAILGYERLIVSEQPGTTRDSVEAPFTIGEGKDARRYVFVDTAGIRKIRRVRETVEKYSVLRAIRSIERADIVGLMIESVQGPTEQDKKIAARIVEAKKGALILVSKWDLAKGVTQREYIEAVRRELFFLDYAPVLCVSAQTGFHVRQTIEVIDRIAGQLLSRIPTGVLNRLLHNAVERVQPPDVKGRRLKIYYATQTDVKPITFVLFVNDPELMTDAYRTYLTHSLREAFGLEGAPIVLRLRPSHRRPTD